MRVVVIAYTVYVYLAIPGRAPMSNQFVAEADTAPATRLEVVC